MASSRREKELEEGVEDMITLRSVPSASVCVSVCVCVRACVRASVRACVCVCVKVEIRTRKMLLAVGEACVATFRSISGTKRRTLVSSRFS